MESFKNYISRLNQECDAFFQYNSNDKTGYDNNPVGKNSLATMMKEISEDAKLSRIYTNHCIRKTTAMALHCQGFDVSEIQNVTKHKNLDSLKHYIAKPTYKEKQSYNQALLNYAENEEISENIPPKRLKCDTSKQNKQKKRQIEEPTCTAVTPIMPNKENVDVNNCLIPLILEDVEESVVPCTTTMQSNVVNTMAQASNMFQNATFNNCNFSFQMPK